MKRNIVIGSTLLVAVATLGIIQACAPAASEQGDGATAAAMNTDYSSDGMAPMFEVDPFWPKPLPNH